jgi:uncharacterized membrane protein HdeD (DUF308 family)
MKQLLLSNWHAMRFIRLAFALFLFFQAFETQEWFLVAFGTFFLIQEIFNTVCVYNVFQITKKKLKDY